MKLFITVLLCLFIFSKGEGQTRKTPTAQKVKSIDKPAPELKQYWFVMLLKGPNTNHDSLTSARIQEGHMANINRLAGTGKLMVAGPFGDDGNWRGIFILDCKDQAEAEKLLQTDPAISSGRLAYEIHPWWTVKNEVFK